MTITTTNTRTLADIMEAGRALGPDANLILPSVNKLRQTGEYERTLAFVSERLPDMSLMASSQGIHLWDYFLTLTYNCALKVCRESASRSAVEQEHIPYFVVAFLATADAVCLDILGAVPQEGEFLPSFVTTSEFDPYSMNGMEMWLQMRTDLLRAYDDAHRAKKPVSKAANKKAAQKARKR